MDRRVLQLPIRERDVLGHPGTEEEKHQASSIVIRSSSPILLVKPSAFAINVLTQQRQTPSQPRESSKFYIPSNLVPGNEVAISQPVGLTTEQQASSLAIISSLRQAIKSSASNVFTQQRPRYDISSNFLPEDFVAISRTGTSTTNVTMSPKKSSSPRISPEQDEIAAIQHWSVYGAKGSPPGRRISPEEWEVKPFKKPASTKWKGPSVPAAQVVRLLNGFCPSDAVEEKWFVYADGPDSNGNAAVHMHRSWGGEKMVELRLRLKSGGGDAKVREIVWESDPNLWRWASEEFAKATATEVCDWILDVKLSASK